MGKTITRFLLGLAALLLLAPASSEAQSRRRADAAVVKKTDGQREDFLIQQFRKQHKLLFNRRTPQQTAASRKGDFSLRASVPNAPLTVTKAPGRHRIVTADGTVLWACVYYDPADGDDAEEWSFVRFNPSAPNEAEQIRRGDDLICNGGSGITNDVFYMLYWGSFMGNFYPMLYKYELPAWKKIYDNDQGYAFTDVPLTFIATETAQDVRSGVTYGQFFGEGAESLEYGIVDYAKQERTTIAEAEHQMVALGIDSEGTLYGISMDADLYRIDSKTGEETKVGATGLTLKFYEEDDEDEEEPYIYMQGGEIDQRTNTFYWAAVDSEGKSAIYTVDLKTGVATKLADADCIYTSLLVEPADAKAGVPAKVADAKMDFAGGVTSGQLTFTAPATSETGEALSGELTYTIYDGARQAATGTCQAGAAVSVALSLESGWHMLGVTVASAAGQSKAVTLSEWIGFDQPKDVTGAKLAIDSKTGEAVVTWDAPAGGVHDGYIGNVLYTVTRQEGSRFQIVAQGISDTSFKETLDKGALTPYSYAILAYNTEFYANTIATNTVIFGQALEVPYLEQFDTKEAFDNFTVINANNDYSRFYTSLLGTGGAMTWAYDADTQNASFNYGNDATATDDWLITPPINLKAGRTYTLKFQAWTYSYDEIFEVKMGQGTRVEDMTTQVIDLTTFQQVEEDGKRVFVNNRIAVDADGEYNIGFHSANPEGSDFFEIKIDSISLDVNPLDGAPAAVEGLTVTPGAKGALRATVSFTTPTKTYGGGELSAISRVEVRRANQVVATKENPATGEAVSIDLNVTEAGVYEYEVVAINGEGNGEKLSASAFVGPDLPFDPANIRFVTYADHITVTWDKQGEVGPNGGYVDPAEVVYVVASLRARGSRYVIDEEYPAVKGVNTVDIPYNAEEGYQHGQYFAVAASNAVGETNYIAESALIGKTYETPYTENFQSIGNELDDDGNYVKGHYWANEGQTGMGSVSLYEDAFDGDGFSFRFGSSGVVERSMATGKISVKGAQHPAIYFAYKATRNANHELGLDIRKIDGTVDTLETISFAQADASEWRLVNLSLDKYKDEPYIRIAFRYNSKGRGTKSVLIDDLLIGDLPENNLRANLSATTEVLKGQTAQASFSVYNTGTKPAQGYTVRLTANGETLFEETATEPLASMAGKSYTADVPTTTLIAGEALNLRLTVDYEDGDAADNTAETAIKLTEATDNIPATDLTATPQEGGVELAWNGPSTDPVTLTEDFESPDYEAFDLGGISEDDEEGRLGPWRLFDGNLTGTVSWTSASYDNQFEPMAWQVFEPGEVFDMDESANQRLVGAHSGGKYLLSMIPADDETTRHWLISPELTGEEQTVKFFTKCLGERYSGKEKYQILYSEEDPDIDTFELLAEKTITAWDTWEEVSFELPEGALYFAIRHVTPTDEGFGMLIDDITYQVAPVAPESYRVYRDGKLIGEVDASDELAFTDADYVPGTSAAYAVVAVYANGSEAAPATAQVTTGINAAKQGRKAFNVYSVDGRLVRQNVRSLDGLKGLYLIGNQKVVVK